MDIKQENFWSTLPLVLKTLTEATFMTIDLEMTGIRTKSTIKHIKPTIEEVYQQAKSSAEGYQILQFGLTCIRHDKLANVYTTQSFNFHITPMFIGSDRAGNLIAKVLDRRIALSYGSLLFLQSHGFQLDKAFKDGVCYLGRQEAAEAAELLLRDRRQRSSDDHVDISSQDQITRDFYSSVKSQISSWLQDPEAKNFLNIANPYGGRLNHLQTRLITQLVESEFPEYRAFPRCGNLFMQVVKLDSKREYEIWSKDLGARKAAVARQTGFGFLIEALVGGDFASSIEPLWLVPRENRGCPAAMSAKLGEDLRRYEEILKAQRPILVGHNSLYDLLYIFQTFIGPLPPTAGEFKRDIHRLFPRVVDTKHLASRGNHSMVGDDSLEDLFASVKGQVAPMVRHEAGYGYEISAAHEAGYDSWMTSVVFVKLSWKLSNTWESLPRVDGKERQAPENGSAGATHKLVAWRDTYAFALKATASNPVAPAQAPATIRPRDPFLPTSSQAPSISAWKTKPLPAAVTAPPPAIGPQRGPWVAKATSITEKAKPAPTPAPAPTFAPRPPLTATSASPSKEPPRTRAYKVGSWRDQPSRSPERFPASFQSLRQRRPAEIWQRCARGDGGWDNAHRGEQKPQAVQSGTVWGWGGVASQAKEDCRIPAWGTEFWKRYGNKLRVGSAGVLDLAED